MRPELRADAESARVELLSGALRGPRLLERLQALPVVDRDPWVDVLLGIVETPDDCALPRGGVPYWPCGVEEILALVHEVPLTPEAELVDLGSGLGRVVMLAHLLSGARACGIEIQPPLVESAIACSAELGLEGVSFVRANAAEAELDGSIFFLYAPFNGELLTQVLARVEAVARRRPIVVCAVALDLRTVPWLQVRKSTDAITVYDSRAPVM
jgi:hypothetical protein